MIKSNKNNKKKKGFTLVELIAVIAIIGILAAILIPSISGYITKAKKTKVIEQARTFVMAVETLSAEGKMPVVSGTAMLKADATIANLTTSEAFADLVGATTNDADAIEVAMPKLIPALTYPEAALITAGGTTGEFNVDENGVFTEMK